MIIDSTAAARRADPARAQEWLANQRVFISSAMADTTPERRAVADVVDEAGARPIWFEEFGRDADAEEAYLTEVDSSTVYLAILNELYGRPNPPDGDSATEMEYRRAREGGKRINVFVASEAPEREGALARFIERIRFFVTTEDYRDTDDLARRVTRRLNDLAAEALSPWVKLGDYVFRADEVVDTGSAITIRARTSDEIAYQLQTLGSQSYGRQPLRFVSRNRVADADLTSVQRTTRAGGADELTIELSSVRQPQGNAMRASTGGYSADDLVELGMRSLFLGEAIPSQIGILGFMADTAINPDDLRQAFELPNEFAEAITRLVVADGLVSSGNASRVLDLSLGPRTAGSRRLALEWEGPQTYANAQPDRRVLEGDWRPN